MTLYETLKEKAERCRRAAINSTNEEMRAIWLKHAEKLEERAGNLPVVKATQRGQDGN